MYDRRATRLTSADGWAWQWIHLGGHGATWICFRGNHTDLSFAHMTQKQSYEFRLSSILERMQEINFRGDLSQSRIFPHINYSCFDARFSRGWFCALRTHWNTALNIEHHVLVHAIWRAVAGRHNDQIYLVRLTNRVQISVLSALFDWTALETSHLLQVPTRSVFAFYSNFILKDTFRTLMKDNEILEAH